MTTDARITALIEGLLEGHPERRVAPARFGGERNYLRALMNIQAPGSLPAEWFEVQDQLLREENEARAITPRLIGVFRSGRETSPDSASTES